MTVNFLLKALQELPEAAREAEVRLVLSVREAERGPQEGLPLMKVAPVACMAIGQVLMLFVDQDLAVQEEIACPPLPPDVRTGDPAYDERRRQQSEGDEDDGASGDAWKKG